MEKDYDKWNEKKKNIHSAARKHFRFSEGEIWFCIIGINLGFGQDGSGENFFRPVVIIKKVNDTQFIGIPLTRTMRIGSEFLSLPDDHGPSTALLAQVRFFDAKRLIYFSETMDIKLFEVLKLKFIDLINSYPRPIHRWDIREAGEQADSMNLPRSQNDDPQIDNTPDDNIVK